LHVIVEHRLLRLLIDVHVLTFSYKINTLTYRVLVIIGVHVLGLEFVH